MADPQRLERFALVPVIELEPGRFATQTRQSPGGSSHDMPDAWNRYWLDALADAGITGLRPLCPGSWHVPTKQLSRGPTLGRILSALIAHWGGMDTLTPDEALALSGGLALCDDRGGVLVEPQCCGDLGNRADWRAAATGREPDWATLWIGHPWISARFEGGWLILSEPHEGDSAAERWAVRPDALERSLTAADVELNRLANEMAATLNALGFSGDATGTAMMLAGLANDA